MLPATLNTRHCKACGTYYNTADIRGNCPACGSPYWEIGNASVLLQDAASRTRTWIDREGVETYEVSIGPFATAMLRTSIKPAAIQVRFPFALEPANMSVDVFSETDAKAMAWTNRQAQGDATIHWLNWLVNVQSLVFNIRNQSDETRTVTIRLTPSRDDSNAIAESLSLERQASWISHKS